MQLTTASTSSASTLEVLLDLNAEIGEGPIWDASSATLILVESFSGTVYRYHPASAKLASWQVGQPIGVAIPRRRGGLVVSGRDGLLSLEEHSGQVDLLVPIEQDTRGNRMNDAKCDSRGRLWAGTFSTSFEPRAGALYRVDPDHTLAREYDGVYIANGIAWSPDETRMYFADTARRGVDVFDYVIATGKATNRRRFVDIDRADGLPDGIAMDAEGCLWVALYGGGAVRRYTPEGRWIGTVELPVKGVTSCGFGGEGLRDLYITTGWHLPEWALPSPREHAGALFRCRTGVAGMPVYPFGG